MKWPAAVMLPPAPDAVLDRFASLAAATLQAPMAVLSLLDDDKQQVLPGAYGMPTPWQQQRRLELTHSLCRFVIDAEGSVVVDDVTDDEQSQTSRAVTDFGVRSWVATPLRFSLHHDSPDQDPSHQDPFNHDSDGGDPTDDGGEHGPDLLAVPSEEGEARLWGVLCVMDERPRSGNRASWSCWTTSPPLRRLSCALEC